MARRARAKREIDARVDLGLPDAVEVVLDRVLDGDDVGVLGVELPEHGVQRRRLSRSGRAGDQNDAVRLANEIAQGRERGVGHPETGQVEPSGLLVEEPQYHALAVRGGQDRNAHIDRPAREAQRDAPVLRLALLGDIQARHDLDARYDHAVRRLRRLEHVAQHAVPAEAHHRAPLEGLDVDVRSVLAHRLGEECVDQPHDGRVVLALQEIGDLGKVLRERREVRARVEVGDDLGGVRGAAFVGARQRRVESLVASSRTASGPPSARCTSASTPARTPGRTHSSKPSSSARALITPCRLAKAYGRRSTARASGARELEDMSIFSAWRCFGRRRLRRRGLRRCGARRGRLRRSGRRLHRH